MKSLGLHICAAALAIGPALAAESDPYRPTGEIDVLKKYVRTGTKAQVSWNIQYPVRISDLLIPGPGGRVTTTEEVRVKMRVAGVAFQSGARQLPAAFNAKIGSGPWQQLFVGKGNQVKPTEYVFDEVVPAGTELNFGAQGARSNGGWYDARWTSGSDLAVTGLLNGDTPPSYAPAYEQGNIESFLSAYISEDNEIQIGPRDMIYLFELASRDPGDWWFDMQDLVVIVTYEQTSTTQVSSPPVISQDNRGGGQHRPGSEPLISQNNGLSGRHLHGSGTSGAPNHNTVWKTPSGTDYVRD